MRSDDGKRRWQKRLMSASCVAALACTGQFDAPGDESVPGIGSQIPTSEDGTELSGPPRPPMFALNKLEYENAIRELLAVEATTDSFPADGKIGGFDKGTSISTAEFSQYDAAARDAIERSLAQQPVLEEVFQASDIAERNPRSDRRRLGSPVGNGEAWALSGGILRATITPEVDASVTIEIYAGGTAIRTDTPDMELLVNGQSIERWTVSNTPAVLQSYSARFEMTQGTEYVIEVDTPNYVGEADTNNELVVSTVSVRSDATQPGPGRELLFSCSTEGAEADACYRQTLLQFARRAWRRPVNEAESAALGSLYSDLSAAEGADEGFKLALRAVLTSPHFLFHALRLSDTQGPLLGDAALASRLSLFLWSSIPDEKLLSAAEAGTLQDETALAAQVERMLADPRMGGWVDGFVEQWLKLREFANKEPPQSVFPDFDLPLRRAMNEETKRFVTDFLSNGLPASKLLSPGFRYINERLASHYGENANYQDWTREDRTPEQRQGLLELSAWLSVLTDGEQPSPVQRGIWVLREIVCREMPPPPPNVPALPQPEASDPKSAAERLEAHRTDPVCAGCHDLIDPVGLGFEVFDAVGVQRSEINGVPIESTGSLPITPTDNDPTTLLTFASPRDLAQQLEGRPDFLECMTQRLYEYGLSRELTNEDHAVVAQLAEQSLAAGTSLSDQLLAISLSTPFRQSPSNAEE